MSDVFDRYYHRDNIPERLKKKLSIQDMRELAQPLADEIERLQARVDELERDRENGVVINAKLKFRIDKLVRALQDIQGRAPKNGEDVSYLIAKQALGDNDD